MGPSGPAGPQGPPGADGTFNSLIITGSVSADGTFTTTLPSHVVVGGQLPLFVLRWGSVPEPVGDMAVVRD